MPADRPTRINPGLGVLLQVAAGLVVTVVLLAAMEFTAGFFVEHGTQPEIPGDTVSRTVTWIDVNPAPLVRDVDLLWRNKPGINKTLPVNPKPFGRDDQWTIENNSEGFRGPERMAVGPGEKVFRILCVGDSITFGFNVDQDATYPRQLLALLQTRYPGRRFEIVNTGVPGWSWLQGLKFIESRGLAMKPDLIIVGHGTNDQFFPAKIPDEDRFLLLGGPVKRSLNRMALFASETNTFRAVSRMLPPRPVDAESRGCRQQIDASGVCFRVSVEQITATVREIARISANAGVGLLVANTDFVQTRAVEGSHRAVAEDRIPFIDLVEELYTRRRSDEDARSIRLGLAKATEPAAPTAAASDGPKRVLLRVLVPDAGRTYRVEGTGVFQKFAFAEPAYDDGTHGDERPGDGVFSVAIEVPANVSSIAYKFYQGDIAEFTPLPPLASTLGVRVIRTPASRIGPVYVFGQSMFMAEGAHPNRDGHQVIAGLLADKLEEMPAFHEYVRETGSSAAATGADTHP
jgi:lysophospholipase L1-like esterase